MSVLSQKISNSTDDDKIGIESEATDDNNSNSDVEGSQSADSNSGDDDKSNSEDDEVNGNVGWADSMAKILKSNKPKGKKTLILSKAKKHKLSLEKKSSVDFEVVGDDGEEKKEVVKIEDAENKDEPITKKARELHPDLRTKPNILDREREKLLSKIATRGVVQLFNAVRNQQKDIEKDIEKAGPLERKKEKVIKSLDKNKFLDNLMGQSKSENVNKTLEVKKEIGPKKEKKETWNVFREDFMMGAKMKDWNKKEPEENESSAKESDDSD